MLIYLYNNIDIYSTNVKCGSEKNKMFNLKKFKIRYGDTMAHLHGNMFTLNNNSDVYYFLYEIKENNFVIEDDYQIVWEENFIIEKNNLKNETNAENEFLNLNSDIDYII